MMRKSGLDSTRVELVSANLFRRHCTFGWRHIDMMAVANLAGCIESGLEAPILHPTKPALNIGDRVPHFGSIRQLLYVLFSSSPIASRTNSTSAEFMWVFREACVCVKAP
jgi:hypothetical protein